MNSNLRNSAGLAFLDVLSNGVGAAVLLITIFGASLVAQTRGLSSRLAFDVQIISEPDIALAAMLRTKGGLMPVALTEQGENGELLNELVNVGTIAAVTSVRRSTDREAILSISLPSTDYVCLAVYTPMLNLTRSAPSEVTISVGNSTRKVSVGWLRPTTWVSVRRVRSGLVIGSCDGAGG